MFLQGKTDEELMILYKQGAEEVFKLLYERHSAKVLGFLKSRVRNKEKAHDIFQEVFLKIHKSKHLYNETLPFLPWLFTITKNALVDEIRKNSKEKSHVSGDKLALASPEAEETAELGEVLPLLQGLPRNQKRVLEMRYIEEKTFEEISLALETSPVNARKLLSRGVQRMKELLTEGDKP